MEKIDLHVHSTMSDGTFSPAELVSLAKKKGLFAFALTDHDTISGLAAARKAAREEDIEFINGMEASVDYKGRKIHVVSLCFEPEAPSFQALYRKIRRQKEAMADEVIELIRKKGIDISKGEVEKFVYPGCGIERYAIMRYLVSLNIEEKVQSVWDKYLTPALDELGADKNISIDELAEGVHGAGGIISLAHFHKRIGLKDLNRKEQEMAIGDLVSWGLDAMERYYPSYSEDDAAFAVQMIERYDLLATGGSDFHGKNRPGIELGSGYEGNLSVPYAFLAAIKKGKKR